MVLLEVKDAFSNVEALKKLAILFKTAYLPQAEQTLKSSLIGYEANQIDFLNLLDSQRMLLEFKLDYFKALVDLEISLAELERAVGTHLERSGGQ
jgi:outer membrane protein TolC